MRVEGYYGLGLGWVGSVFLTNGYMGGCSKMFAVVKCWFNIQITNDSRYTLGGRKIQNLL